MTLSTSIASQTFPGNGLPQLFPCTFRIFNEGDVMVTVIDPAAGTMVLMTLNTDYTIAGAGDASGFTLSTTLPVASGKNLLVARVMPYTQPTDFTNQGAFFPTMHEDAMDRLSMQIQQLAGSISRSLRVPDGLLPEPSAEIPIPSPLAPLVWNADGTALENGDLSAGDLLLRSDLASTAAGKGAELVGSIQLGAGAVPRTVQDELRDRISVKQFGARGDGVTNDTASVAAALAAANGRTLYFPSGTYLISSSLQLTSGNNVSLLGESAGGSVLKASSMTLTTKDFIDWYAASDFSIVNMTFDLSGVITSGLNGAIGTQNCKNFKIDRCKIINMVTLGINCNGPQRFSITNNYISLPVAFNTQNQAIIISSAPTQPLDGDISNNILVNSGMDITCTRCRIANNYISGWMFGAGITTEQHAYSSEYKISNNVIFSSSGLDSNGYRPGGIENWGAQSIITSNHIRSCSGSGIDQGGNSCVVMGNFCFENGNGETPGGSGIISRYGNSTYNASNSIYVGNRCTDAQTPRTQKYGYEDQSSALSNITLYGNDFWFNLNGPQNILGARCNITGPSFETSLAFTPPVVAAGGQYVSSPVTIAGTLFGDYVQVSHSQSLLGCILSGYVNATNQVTIVIHNGTASSQTIAAGTLRVKVTKPINYAQY